MASLHDLLNRFPYNVGLEQPEKLNEENSKAKQELVDRHLLSRLKRSQLINEALSSEDGVITLKHAKALTHRSLFGRQSFPSLTCVGPHAWKSHEFRKPFRPAWSLPIPPFQLGKL